jgi:hypothetical protein
MARLAALASIFVPIVCAAPGAAQLCGELKFSPSVDRTTFLGLAVAADGDLIVMGEMDTAVGSAPGSVWVYRFNGAIWTPEAVLRAADGLPGDGFGRSVAVFRDVIVVGAPIASGNGAAYLFRHDGRTWTEEARFLASDGQPDDGFGRCVAVSHGVVVVGAPWTNRPPEFGAGTVYVYRHHGGGWRETILLPSSSPPRFGSRHFGKSVAASDGLIVAGASGDASVAFAAGVAHVFRHDGATWFEEDKLIASDARERDDFGSSLALSDDLLVVGATEGDGREVDAGAAYVYVHDGSTWFEAAKLTASDGQTLDLFGASVALSGDLIVTGAFGDDDLGNAAGSVYVFRFDGTTWVEQRQLLPFDGRPLDLFGASVAVAGGVAVVGAPFADAVYLYRTTESVRIGIDIKPGDDANTIKPSVDGIVPVALLGSELFDVKEVDPKSPAFGPAGARPVHSRLGDFNGDGRTDLLVHFRTQDIGIRSGSTVVRLTALTFAGIPVCGQDRVRLLLDSFEIDGRSRADKPP